MTKIARLDLLARIPASARSLRGQFTVARTGKSSCRDSAKVIDVDHRCRCFRQNPGQHIVVDAGEPMFAEVGEHFAAKYLRYCSHRKQKSRVWRLDERLALGVPGAASDDAVDVRVV